MRGCFARIKFKAAKTGYIRPLCSSRLRQQEKIHGSSVTFGPKSVQTSSWLDRFFELATPTEYANLSNLGGFEKGLRSSLLEKVINGIKKTLKPGLKKSHLPTEFLR